MVRALQRLEPAAGRIRTIVVKLSTWLAGRGNDGLGSASGQPSERTPERSSTSRSLPVKADTRRLVTTPTLRFRALRRWC